VALANDSGIYSVVPFGAQYDKKASVFRFTGQYAQELKKLLPPGFSVITGMQPALKNAYEKNFRGLQMKDASGNALEINCSSAEIISGANGQFQIKENPQTTCAISLVDKSMNEVATQPVQVKDALQKASQANQLK